MTLTPCLQLCAPVGMGSDDKDTWFEAAYVALSDYPADKIREAARKAMGTADHPSKVIPAIVREIEAREKSGYQSMPNPITPPSQSTYQRELPSEERRKVAQTMGDLVKKLVAAAPGVDDVLGKKSSLSD